MTPLLSVVVPVFNGARYLAAALDSVLADAGDDVELVVVDDGSTDASASIAAGYPSVRLLRQDNRGPAAARNRGVEAARGEYLAFLDADDLWPAGRFAWQRAALASDAGPDLVQGLIQPVAADGVAPAGEPLYANSLCSALLRRATFERVGPLDESLRYCEDVDWCFAARRAGLRTERRAMPALYYRRHDSNATRHRDLLRQHTLRVIAKHRRQGPEPVC